MANIKISELPAASAASTTQEFETNESGTSKKVTGSQLKAFVKDGLVVADVTDLTATAAELNYTDGVTGNIQMQINDKPSLTGSGASGTWGVSVTGSAGKISRTEVTGYNWNGSVLSIYWTRIGRVTGDSVIMASLYSSTDANYANTSVATVTFKSLQNTSISAQLDTLTANENDIRIAIDNNGDCWIYSAVVWGSFARYNVEETYGNPTLYSSPTQQTATPTNSLVLFPGQAVRATYGNVTSGVPYNTTSHTGNLYARGNVTAASFVGSGANLTNLPSAYTLLGTISTTSGTSQTLSGLNLTSYKFLQLILTQVSLSGVAYVYLTNTSGPTIANSSGGNGQLYGDVLIDLSNGICSANTGGGAQTVQHSMGGNCGITTASTSVTVATTNQFDLGSIRVYGVK